MGKCSEEKREPRTVRQRMMRNKVPFSEVGWPGSLSEEVTTDLRLRWWVHHRKIWERNVPARGAYKCPWSQDWSQSSWNGRTTCVPSGWGGEKTRGRGSSRARFVRTDACSRGWGGRPGVMGSSIQTWLSVDSCPCCLVIINRVTLTPLVPVRHRWAG